MGVAKSMGVPEPFLKSPFFDCGIFFFKLPESENGGLEPPLSLKPPFNGFFFKFLPHRLQLGALTF